MAAIATTGNRWGANWIHDELIRWRDEALAGGNRELAARLHRVAVRMRHRAKAWKAQRAK